jgi:ATP-dependent DNA ligase
MTDVLITFVDQKIYKKDSKGKMRVLHIFTEGADLVRVSGIVGGNLKTDRKTCTPKNIGKANETTGETQALLEGQSKIEEKLGKDYFKTEEAAQNTVLILPMLAKDFKKEVKKVVFPCYGQPKLDGQRALGSTNKRMISRGGKDIETMAHIEADLNVLAIADYLDGELYAHGHTFQENIRAIKKVRTELDPDTNTPLTADIKYHVYDMVLPMPFIDRYRLLGTLVANSRNIELVPTVVLRSQDDLDTFHQKNLADGYEGTIVRWGEDGYKVNARATQLLKYKDFKDMACVVTDIIPSEAKPEQGIVVCMLNGQSFKASLKFSHKERAEMLTNKSQYIGETAEIRYFELTDGGLPRFPVCVGFKND